MQNRINQGSGVHVVIENDTKIPSIVSKGISVVPGAETHIGLQTTKILRLEAPFKSNCTRRYLDETLKQILGEVEYSSKNCKGMCYVIKFYEGCNCIHPVLFEGLKIEVYYDNLGVGQKKVCNITLGSNDMNCMTALLTEMIEDPYPCDCNPECVEGRYRVRNLQNITKLIFQNTMYYDYL